MYEICCKCEWVPGRHGFPPHVHRTRTVIRHRADHQIIEMTSHWMSEGNPAWEVIEQEEIVLISVNWKEVARGLCRGVEAVPG